MSYGFMWRSAADMVAKILRGTKAGDILMEQPTTYELAINAATARRLGIRIPESIRVCIDRVIDHSIAWLRVGDATLLIVARL